MGRTLLGGVVTAQSKTVSLAATDVEVADAVLAAVQVPVDATILEVILENDDLDSGAALVLDVGDGNDDDRFIAAQSGQAATAARASGTLLVAPYTYDELAIEPSIEVTVNTPAGTGIAGDLTLTAVYFRNE